MWLQEVLKKLNEGATVLVLWDNHLGEGGGKAIADALKVNTTLAKLDLLNNQLGEVAETAIRQSWGYRGLFLSPESSSRKSCLIQ